MDGGAQRPKTYMSDGARYCERTGRQCINEAQSYPLKPLDPYAYCTWCDGMHAPVKFRPLRHRILVLLDRKQASYGSLVIPDTAQRQPQKATVVAVGPDADEIEVGMRVAIGKWNGLQVEAPEGFDRHREFWVLNADPELRLNSDARIRMDEVYGVIVDEDGVMRVPD